QGRPRRARRGRENELVQEYEDRPSHPHRRIGRKHHLRRCGENGAQRRLSSRVRLRWPGCLHGAAADV
ncbi:unnamed protein product, partial [Laminaria digitata]